MGKNQFYINRESLLIMGIDPEEAVNYIESKKASTIDPVHIKGLDILRKKPKVHSPAMFMIVCYDLLRQIPDYFSITAIGRTTRILLLAHHLVA